ncbi:MAG: PAS domain S-box protein [Elusimicrobiota bacterium]
MPVKTVKNDSYILIVEDDRGTSELEAQSLEPLGKEIRRAYTVEETLAALQRSLPELMLLDYSLPGTNAIELLEMIRKKGITLPPFLIVTGRGDEGVAVETMKAGAQDYVIKDSYFLKNLLPATSKALEKAEIVKELQLSKRSAEAERQKYEELFTFAPVPYLALDSEGHVFEGNLAWCKTFGYSAGDIEGRWAGDFLAEEYRVEFRRNFAAFIKKGSLEGLELSVLTKTGQIRKTVLSGRVVKDTNNNFERAQCAFTDITERADAELELKTITRMYNLLARVNQVAVQEKTVKSLLQEICNAVVAAGGFRMAWAGTLDRDTEAIRPLCSAGAVHHYLDGIQVSAGDGTAGQGPGGIAARTGKITRVDDIGTDPRMERWREKALERGYRSVTSIPLRSGRKVAFVLNFYSGAPGSFIKQELDLLKEIQNDTSLALENIETEEKRSRAQAALEQTSAYLARIMDANPVMLYTLKNDGKTFPCVWISGSARRILGYDTGEILTQGWFKANLHPQDQALVTAAREEMIRAGCSEADYRFRKKDGSYIWVKAQMSVPKNGGDISGSWTDITLLKESESRLQALLNALPDGLIVRRGYEIIFANKGALSLTGVKKSEDLLGRAAPDLLPSQLREDFIKSLKEIDTKEIATPPVAALLNRADGKTVEIEISGAPIVFGGERCGLVIFRPLPGKKQPGGAKPR